ncbi:HupE/UreJ family protein [Erythrobacter litoralis]|uniref:Putative membrane protein n=1 Tax=Erythrobacter litoralis (strain HTCC2594) TaxID=314225 RepID=Q2N7N8_ERYLH|nr:HupE/UreJ family protein [Erythrobacter litoralis]ABC64303.1 putative membrane protein [Erythrobacter litoralis HTCC2594]
MIRRLLAFVLTLVAAPVAADELRPGYVEFAQRDAEMWELNWKQPLPAPGPAELAIPIVPQGCTIVGEPLARTVPLALIGSAQIRCEGEVADGQIGFEAIFGGGDVLLRVQPLGRQVQTYRLTEAEPIATIAAAPTSAQVWRSYFSLGIEHILEGWDHLLFVIALVLLVRRGWAVAKATTAFTVAHSLTLAGVSLGFFGLPGRPVEAVIALSIVLLAVETVRDQRQTWTRRWPWLVAFLFGLIHGFGFAGALREIGLPEGEVPAALISFNLGVEAGQLAVVAVVLLVLEALRRIRADALAPMVRYASYAIGITGSYWLVDRLVG